MYYMRTGLCNPRICIQAVVSCGSDFLSGCGKRGASGGGLGLRVLPGGKDRRRVIGRDRDKKYSLNRDAIREIIA